MLSLVNRESEDDLHDASLRPVPHPSDAQSPQIDLSESLAVRTKLEHSSNVYE